MTRGPKGGLHRDFQKGHDPLIRPEDVTVKSGKHSVALSVAGIQGHTMVQKYLPAAEYAGKTLTLGAWMRGTRSEVAAQILDFVHGEHTTSSGSAPGDDKWHFVTATRTIRPDATGSVILRLSQWIPVLKGAATVKQAGSP